MKSFEGVVQLLQSDKINDKQNGLAKLKHLADKGLAEARQR